ncbi:MAG TPA: Uma2 family endonuclease [Gemmatimonadaceae bacterium]|nr:Uma2 family endonuclease [Gemmatimonadaceae bacterium]
MTDAARYIGGMTYPAFLTADELLRLNIPDKRTELIEGRLVVREPAGFRHGDVAMSLGLALGNFVRAHDLGRVLAAETGFKLASNPDTVRAPDVAFVQKARVPDPPPRGYPALAPDLAVEVLSPDDRPGEVLARVGSWLRAGTRLVWVIDPDRRQARVYREDGSESIVREVEALEGEDVLPGFEYPLADVV